jgi:hypoxanthine phosphoribosyltransferase
MVLKNDLLPFLTRDSLNKLVSQLAKKIDAHYDGQDVVLVCPLKGSIHFCTDLAQSLQCFAEIDFVQLQRIKDSGCVRIVKDISTDIRGKHVLIVEEIIDSAKTLSFLYDHLNANRPSSLKIVSLLDKPARRELNLKADFIGQVIEDRFVIGYGMDFEEFGRNYPDIYILKN